MPVPHCEARKEKTTEGQNLPLVQDETHPDFQMLTTYHLKYDVLLQVSVSFFLGQGQFLCLLQAGILTLKLQWWAVHPCNRGQRARRQKILKVLVAQWLDCNYNPSLTSQLFSLPSDLTFHTGDAPSISEDTFQVAQADRAKFGPGAIGRRGIKTPSQPLPLQRCVPRQVI